jgi:hypothetical protein
VVKIKRVAEIFIPRRNRVIIKRNEGNTEKSSGLGTYMLSKRIPIETARFNTTRISTTGVGSAANIIATNSTIMKAINKSLLFNNDLKSNPGFEIFAVVI